MIVIPAEVLRTLTDAALWDPDRMDNATVDRVMRAAEEGQRLLAESGEEG
jgi:hypothetical protein